MRANRMKAKLVRGEPAIGVSIMFASPQLVEIVGRLGFDWVLLDCEHGTISVESLESMTMAAEASGITAIARPRTGGPDAILEVLERGVMGVQVPHVNTAEQARAIVEAVKYHPLGRRGLAARTRPAGYGIGISLDDYARRANEETLVCIQIEEREALDNLADILEVPGVDVFFLGPSDLSQSLGYPGRGDHPDVRGAMQRAFSMITEHGKAAGSAGSAKRWHEYREQGATYLYTHLPTILAAGARAFLDSAATAETVVPPTSSKASR
jgi:2-keto-3-deoxy-L-rhamnonate aldolase RhmA